MSSRTESDNSRTTKRTTVVRTERREYVAYCGCCDWMWLIATVEGWLKILQWITTFLSFVIILAHFNFPITLYAHLPEYNFMLFVAITSWIFVTLHIFLKLPHLFEKLPAFLLHPILGVVFCLVGAVAFLIASSVVLAYHRYQPELKAAAASGYIAMFLFILEALYIFCRGRRAALSETTETKTVESVEKPDKDQLVHEKKIETHQEKDLHGFPE